MKEKTPITDNSLLEYFLPRAIHGTYNIVENIFINK